MEYVTHVNCVLDIVSESDLVEKVNDNITEKPSTIYVIKMDKLKTVERNSSQLIQNRMTIILKLKPQTASNCNQFLEILPSYLCFQKAYLSYKQGVKLT